MCGGAVRRRLVGAGAHGVRRTLQPLAVLLVALVVVAALAVAIALPPSDNGDPSSRSAGKLGTLALYTWLGRLGLSVSRLSGTFDLGATDVLVDYDPSVHFSAAELDSVMRLVRGGGDLVLVFDARSIDTALPLLQRIGAQVARGSSPIRRRSRTRACATATPRSSCSACWSARAADGSHSTSFITARARPPAVRRRSSRGRWAARRCWSPASSSCSSP